MSLKQHIQSDLIHSLKQKNAEKLSTLRMLSAAITNKEIELRKKDVGLSDEEIIEVIQSEVKKRKDAIEEFKKGKREDLAHKEEGELSVLSFYLPPEMSDEEMSARVLEGIREANAKGPSDFGNVMKVIMPVLKGKASGDRITAIVKAKLSQQEGGKM